MDKHATFWTYFFSGVSATFWFLNENAAAFGVLIALATFFVNLWFKLEARKHGKTQD